MQINLTYNTVRSGVIVIVSDIQTNWFTSPFMIE